MTTTAPDMGEAVSTTDDAPGQPETGVKPIAEMTVEEQLDYFKAKARKAEDLLRDKQNPDIRQLRKANAEAVKEIERLKAETMSETEKLVAQARLEGRSEALSQAGVKLVRAEFRAALAGRDVDADALLEGLDHSRFLDAEGEPDGNAIVAWVERIAPIREERPSGFPDLGQGPRGGTSTTALNGDPLLRDLKKTLKIQ